jgi:hypothetical protein
MNSVWAEYVKERMASHRVFCTSNYSMASAFSWDLTIEASFGRYGVVTGTHYTLDHHDPDYAHLPLPCSNASALLPSNSRILITHVCIHTFGGLLGRWDSDRITHSGQTQQ